ncbi:hypothetical protein E2C01_060967 [Portunus trituberculatus]|uniref:Immunoglobulin I-set domain-containing protein n=1 Tax=Portunus trituberculatus TaxID=210409 RepID=A0A5B7HDS7_PORTR|nr:hypothetical protein [Portunus trituberculatus]
MEIDPATQMDAGYYECQADNKYAVDVKGFSADYSIDGTSSRQPLLNTDNRRHYLHQHHHSWRLHHCVCREGVYSSRRLAPPGMS